ncbi:MAG: outer membrane lipoprotein-sorting protein [Fidelibacterota bacterium]
MRKIFFILLLFIPSLFSQQKTADEILKKVDENMVMDEAITETKMIIHGRTRSRTITAKSWIQGEEKALVEYLSPPREQGKKMLKTKDKIWIYTPEPTDRIITISGHLLRQSVMGSDLSYEDITDNSSLIENYDATLLDDETIMDRDCWVMKLIAKSEDIAYYKRKIWIDKERYLPLREERYAKGGKLLKTTKITDAFQQNGQWVPKHMLFKDELSKGKGTEYIIDSIDFDVDIPDHYFTKAGLKR